MNASVSGKRCSYSNVYAQFIYRDSEMVRIEQKNQTVRVLEKTPLAAESFSVRYMFLNGEDAGYVGMAHAYGSWVMRDTPDKKADETVPLLSLIHIYPDCDDHRNHARLLPRL